MRSVFGNWWICAGATTASLAAVILGSLSAVSQKEQGDPVSRRLKLLKGPEQTLSVDETLGAVFNPKVGVSPRKYYARANPKAEAAIYRVLDNGELKEFHSHAWEILGYVGGESHVPRVEEAIEEFKPISRLLEPDERDTLQALFNSLGVMCGRKIDPACDVAEKMMDPAYWSDAKFRLGAGPISVRYTAISRLMLGYSLSLDPGIDKHSRLILKKVDDPELREALTKAFDRELLLGHGWNTRANEEEPVTAEERRELASYFNGDLKNPGPARPPRYIDPDPPAAGQGEREALPPAESRLEQLARIAQDVELSAEGYIVYLVLQGEEVTNETLTLLGEASQLHSLVLRNVAVTDEGLEDLPRHAPQLRSLSLVNTQATDEGLKHLARLDHLKELSIAHSRKISYRGMNHVGRMDGLTELRLWELPNLTNQGFEDLRSLRNLQVLDLNELPITDAVLEHIASLRSLRELHITNCPIEGRGLAHLEEIDDNITYLSLSGLPLTDDALVYLQNLKSLETLVLKPSGGNGYTMHVTDEAVQRLQEALPETKIIYY